ncbi:MAG: hypothetical protein BWK76_23965 [Desulfobulbaceae bacterium A2]|nr:MAG: hypothetical protein BWK76_23965 [Desulfobulbaceae bacterium A2]
MDSRIAELIETIKRLEKELLLEIEKKEAEFSYHIAGKKVRFEQEMRLRHRQLMQTALRYLADAPILNILTVPIIWSCLLPAAVLDVMVSLYQALCFRVYGIPRVQRGKYIVIDRHALSYLNVIEKINCMYCGYFNGLLAYVTEVAARTEQYWCPIKHARRLAAMHSRYARFLEYGDAEGYRRHLEQVRRDFSDLTSAAPETGESAAHGPDGSRSSHSS